MAQSMASRSASVSRYPSSVVSLCVIVDPNHIRYDAKTGAFCVQQGSLAKLPFSGNFDNFGILSICP